MRFEIYRVASASQRGQWRWRLRADNGEIIAHGESYKNKADCRFAIAIIMRASGVPIIDMTAKPAEEAE